MLRIKYIDNFRAGQPFVVVLCDRDSLLAAHNFFSSQNGAFLDDESITEFSDITPLEQGSIFMTGAECNEIAQRFINLYNANESGHAYWRQ